MEKPPTKLLDRARYRIRLKGYSIRTEQSYVSWIRRFILFHQNSLSGYRLYSQKQKR